MMMWIGLAILAQAGIAQDQTPAERADTAAAERLFAADEPARAAAIYRQSLAQGGFDAAALCFNLGNCLHALGRPAESVLWYTRALRVAPDHLEARANLRLVERQLGLTDSSERALARVWLDGLLARIAATSTGWILAISVGLQLLGWGLLILWRRRIPAIALLAAGLVLAAVVTARTTDATGESAVILRDNVRLLSEPHARVGAVATLQAGERVEVLEASPRWARVRRGNESGWVEAKTLERVGHASRPRTNGS